MSGWLCSPRPLKKEPRFQHRYSHRFKGEEPINWTARLTDVNRPSGALASVHFRVWAVAAAVAVICGAVWLVQGGNGPSQAAQPSSTPEWQTIEHRGVSVDIPGHWQKQDTSECNFEIARWGDPESSPCEFENGITFYGSALFDPAHGPGVVNDTENGSVGWSGYTYAGQFAVYVFNNHERELVRRILSSARDTR